MLILPLAAIFHPANKIYAAGVLVLTAMIKVIDIF